MSALRPQGRQRNYKHVEAWRSPLGSFKGPTLYFNEGEKGERLAFPFRMADGRDGEKLEGALRFRLLECTADDRWRFDLNGVELDQADVDFEFGADVVPLAVPVTASCLFSCSC